VRLIGPLLICASFQRKRKLSPQPAEIISEMADGPNSKTEKKELGLHIWFKFVLEDLQTHFSSNEMHKKTAPEQQIKANATCGWQENKKA